MKAGLLLFAGLSTAAIAQPHKRHQHHAKRQDVVMVTDYVTATAADVVVYVDGNGNPISTSYAGQAAPTPTEAPSSAWVAPSSYAESTPESTPEATTSAAPAPPPASSPEAPPPSSDSSPDTSSPPAPATSGIAEVNGWAFSYSPYNADHTCKSQDQVNSDLATMQDGSMVRLYGTDCNQTATVLNAARDNNMQVFAAVYDPNNLSNELSLIINAAGGNWDNIHTVAIGNEGVNNGVYSVGQVTSAIGTARSTLGDAGYTGKVVTVDTFVAIISNPELCQASDYAAANCHAFFDGNVDASGAGQFVLDQVQRVSAACGGKDTMITESGWPSGGQTNNRAVPSPEDQKTAIQSLKDSFSNRDIVLFSAFNDKWKENFDGSYGAEQFWGIFGDAP